MGVVDGPDRRLSVIVWISDLYMIRSNPPLPLIAAAETAYSLRAQGRGYGQGPGGRPMVRRAQYRLAWSQPSPAQPSPAQLGSAGVGRSVTLARYNCPLAGRATCLPAGRGRVLGLVTWVTLIVIGARGSYDAGVLWLYTGLS